jgi:L-fuconolactonase
MRILDTHHHLWKYYPAEYAWIDDRMAVLKRDYLPDDLAGLIGSANVISTVAVQARQTPGETDWLLSLAERSPFIKGVVGWVDLCSDSVDEQLERFCSNPELVGVRHVVHDEPDDRFMYRQDFRNGLSMLRKYGLTYDILIFPRHLEAAIDLVKAFPGQPFVIDHLAKPMIREGSLHPWKELIRTIAGLQNVWCKLSGMVTEADWLSWNPQDLYPFLDIVFDAFGTDRLMIGSDWPVCNLAGSYGQVMGILPEFMERREMPDSDRIKVLYDNGFKFYNLK